MCATSACQIPPLLLYQIEQQADCIMCITLPVLFPDAHGTLHMLSGNGQDSSCRDSLQCHSAGGFAFQGLSHLATQCTLQQHSHSLCCDTALQSLGQCMPAGGKGITKYMTVVL